MKNTQRSKDFMAIKRNIKSCTNLSQLRAMKEPSLDYYKKNKETDGGELLTIYIEREAELNPDYDYEEDSIESLYHKRTNGFHSKY